MKGIAAHHVDPRIAVLAVPARGKSTWPPATSTG